MTSPMLNFGRHRGQTVAQLPQDYVRWLADPARGEPQPGRSFRPLPADVVAAARERMVAIDAAKLREDFARLCLGGHPTGRDKPVYVIECDGDCYSRSGAYAIDNQFFDTLDATLEYLASEFPIETEEHAGETHTSRAAPDPEDDMIVVWEVLPSGHRKSVWGFFGWHFSSSSETHACGQGSLPGDETSLYDQAMREY